MIKLTRHDDEPLYIAAAHVVHATPAMPSTEQPDLTEIGANPYPFHVRESPAEVARLVAEATRPAAAVDLEAVALARRLVERLAATADAGLPIIAWSHVDPILGLGDDGRASHGASASALRALAARLGAP